VLHEDDDINAEENIEGDNDDPLSTESSIWSRTLEYLLELLESNVTVVYLDFVSDIEQMTELLSKSNTSAMKYTSYIKLDDRVLVEKRFLKGEAPVLVATEIYEFGVDITEVVRIGCPRDILLQEFGHAGRKQCMLANAILYFNEYIDDSRFVGQGST